MTVIGDVKDQICVIVDDIVDTPARSPRPPRPLRGRRARSTPTSRTASCRAPPSDRFTGIRC
jgi:hypothetical protein